MSDSMIRLCRLDAIGEGAAKGFDVNGKTIFAVRKDGRFHVYYNYCPHMGTPLEWQDDQFLDPDGSLIQCSTHGALFRIENGFCLAGPCKGKSLRRLSHTTSDGCLLVDRAEVAALGRI